MTGKEEKSIEEMRFEIVHKQAKLEVKLTKYKKAFEILKEILSMNKDKSIDGKVNYYTLYFNGQFPYETYKYLEKDEYELLEELMKSE